MHTTSSRMGDVAIKKASSNDLNISVVIAVGETKTLDNSQKGNKWQLSSFIARAIREVNRRRLIHAIKFGIALVVVSLLYMLEVVHNRLGDNAMWAVMTVVVVFEFTAGATVSKGMNRGAGTVVGGGLGSIVATLAQEIGGLGKALAIGISIFIFGAAATYMRMIPNIKNKYDYGVMIFILTLSLVAISGVRGDEIIQVASDRLTSICMGLAVCAFMSLFIFPVWAGDELHSSLASKFTSLAQSIQDCLEDYVNQTNGKKGAEERRISACISVLSSKTNDESLANFAKWEPWHGRFGFYYPWNKYLQIGGILRELAACVISAKGRLKQKQEDSSPPSVDSKAVHQAAIPLLASTVRELGESILEMKQFHRQEAVLEQLQQMRMALRSNVHICSVAAATVDQNENDMNGSESREMILGFLLIEILDKVEELVKGVKELGMAVSFANQVVHDMC